MICTIYILSIYLYPFRHILVIYNIAAFRTLESIAKTFVTSFAKIFVNTPSQQISSSQRRHIYHQQAPGGGAVRAVSFNSLIAPPWAHES